ncbi:MAG: hypothetical protein JNK79_02320 [Chitinophagaceae bacterium]|nr:hypothetical protein [Chitinophagaceae bacterium]
MAKKKAAKKNPAKKVPAKNKKVIDEPLKTVLYKQGDLIENFEILEEADKRTKAKDPMPFDIQWETTEATITLHILGGVKLEKSKKK